MSAVLADVPATDASTWELKALAEVAEILDGKRIPVNAKERETRAGRVPYYGATGQVGWIDDFLFDEELVLLGEDGAPFLEPSKPKAYVVRGKSWVNNHAHVLRATAVPTAWLAHYLNMVRYDGLVTGTTRLKLTQAAMRQIRVPVAPWHVMEQRVAELEKQFSRLDEAVANLKRVKANLKRYKAAVLKAAVEGRLVPTEAELALREGRNFESASALSAGTAPPPRPNRFSTRSGDLIPGHAALSVGNLGSSLPAGWAWVPLVDIARMESGHTPSRSRPDWWEGDIPWIGIVDAREHHGGVIQETLQHTNADGLANSAARLLPRGTVCVSRTASVGYVVVMGKAMATSQDFVNWIPGDAVTSEWLRIVFLAEREALLQFGKGSVHKTIYFPEWLSVHIALPPLAEQRRIANQVDRLLSFAEQIEKAIVLGGGRAEAIRMATLTAAFRSRRSEKHAKSNWG